MTVEERGFQDQPAWADHLREAIWAMKAGGQVTPCPSAGYRAEVKGGRDNGVWGGGQRWSREREAHCGAGVRVPRILLAES